VSDFSRREFLKRSVASGVAGGLVLTGMNRRAEASAVGDMGTVIDLTLCDGCASLPLPACVRVPGQEQCPFSRTDRGYRKLLASEPITGVASRGKTATN
jgi:hypothetical protein